MRIIASGDSLFSSRNLATRLDQGLVQQLKQADAVFTNAEFCTPNRTTPPAAGRGYITSVVPETLDEFVDLNIKLVAFANNHTGDFGWQGIVDTMEAAESRKLIYCGVGYSLDEARAAKFLDTPKGRVSVVAASSTRSEVFAASSAGKGIAARPGLNPLRWGQTYVLPDKEFKQLELIDEILGTRQSTLDGLKAETWPLPGPNSFKFGSLFEGNLSIERGKEPAVRTYMNEKDCDEIMNNVKDASLRSDVTIVSLHTHEGKNENWYSPEPASFVEDFCRRAIDEGASAVVGHGAHFMRGVEIYKGKPIFYNLGSLLMEFEAGESKISPEMYEAYGHDRDSLPSNLHGNRTKDLDGTFIGFNADRKHSENCIAILDWVDNELQFKLLPIDLGLDRARSLDRGLPALASEKVGQAIAQRLTEISKKYDTKFIYHKEDGTISIPQ